MTSHDTPQFARTTAHLCVLVALLQTAAAAQDLTALTQQAVRAAAAHVADSVVQIETLGGLERVGKLLVASAPTTGLIVSSDGYVVSSAFNFVQQPSSILVGVAGGKRYPAQIVARDRSRMLVLLKITPDQPLPVPEAAPLEGLRVGQTTIAVGKSFDAEQPNLSTGILSATQRIWGRAVQTDAKISPANYGGPLIDLQGRVLGVLVPLSPDSDTEIAGAEMYDSGIGFAVPLAEILQRLPQWQQGQDLVVGKLGISVQEPQAFDPPPVLAVVKAKSPAAIAGLQVGDRIEQINGLPTERYSQLRHALLPLYAGDEVTLLVRRGEEQLTFTTRLAAEIPPYETAYLGILAENGADGDSLRIRHVFNASPAAQAGLQANDLLQTVATTPLRSPDDLRLALADKEPGGTVALTWQRGAQTMQGDVTLGVLPEQLPEEITAPREPHNPPLAETGVTTLSIPEEPNTCQVYLPASMQQGVRCGVLIYLREPAGEAADKEELGKWQTFCDREHLVLLIPAPANPRSWQRTEVNYVHKLLSAAKTRYAIDTERVVLLGESAGAALADLVVARHRDAIRGLAVVGDRLPQAIRALETEPFHSLAFLFLGQADASAVTDLVTPLRKARFPVTLPTRGTREGELTDDDRALISHWAGNLDRI